MKGVNVIGCFYGSSGLSETARMVVKALKSCNIPYSLISTEVVKKYQIHREPFDELISNKFVYPINLFCLEQKSIISFITEKGWKECYMRHNIGLWYWETDIIPKKSRDCWPFLDELWVTSNYMLEHLSAATQLPVHKIIQPLHVPDASANFHSEKFTFFTFFDFFSVEERKNPLLVIEAFQKAFPQNSKVQLIIKSQNAKFRSERYDFFKNRIKADERIVWIDQSMDSIQKLAFMSQCNCYVSLHSSEGFGLPLAEAMSIGLPVIATGYSGNVEFMNEQNSYLCSYTLQHIGENVPPYPSEGIWAKVDTDNVAHWMKYVFEHPDEAIEKGNQAREDIKDKFSIKLAGMKIQNRLNSISLRRFPKIVLLKYVREKIQVRWNLFQEKTMEISIILKRIVYALWHAP